MEERKLYEKENIYRIDKKIKFYEDKLSRIKVLYFFISLIFIVFGITFYILQPSSEYLNYKIYPMYKVFLLVCAMILLSFISYLMTKEMLKGRINNLIYELKSNSIVNDEENLHQKALKMSYNYLDRYYSQTQDQANKGFIATICVAIFGALIIIGGIISMFFGITEPAYVTIATGAITEFISSIFFYLYNKTVTSMGKYHDKLVLSQNVSYAFELAETISEEKKDDIKEVIIKELVKDINVNLHDKGTD